jgi:hypothetical protein
MRIIENVTSRCMTCGLVWCWENSETLARRHAKQHEHHVIIEKLVLEQINEMPIVNKYIERKVTVNK